MEKIRISSTAVWENKVGYSRALRAGCHVYVTGTTAFNEDGDILFPNDAYKQTKQAILNIEKALKKSGASLNDVVRTRMFVTNIDLWQEVGKAHAEFFGEIKPATSMIEISRLIDPKMLVEIEADAVITREETNYIKSEQKG